MAEKAEKRGGGHNEATESRYIGESHDYDSNRPKKPGRSRYIGAAGAAY